MKTTGVIRRIDELGRIVIPKEIRRNLGIRDGENMEIFTDDVSIILKKHSRIISSMDIINKIGDLTKNIMNYEIMVTDREKVIYAEGTSLSPCKDELLSQDLKNLIDARESINENEEQLINFENSKINGYFSINPIISSNDSIGLVIIYSSSKLSNAEINYSKLLAKLIGEKIDITWLNNFFMIK